VGSKDELSLSENGIWYNDYIVWATSVLLTALEDKDANLATHALSLIADAVFDSLTEEVTQ
jgi:hypothetical protein